MWREEGLILCSICADVTVRYVRLITVREITNWAPRVVWKLK